MAQAADALLVIPPPSNVFFSSSLQVFSRGVFRPPQRSINCLYAQWFSRSLGRAALSRKSLGLTNLRVSLSYDARGTLGPNFFLLNPTHAFPAPRFQLAPGQCEYQKSRRGSSPRQQSSNPSAPDRTSHRGYLRGARARALKKAGSREATFRLSKGSKIGVTAGDTCFLPSSPGLFGKRKRSTLPLGESGTRYQRCFPLCLNCSSTKFSAQTMWAAH